MSVEATAAEIEAFFDQPQIAAIADDEVWTVSDKNKRPIDIKALKREGKIYGARQHNGECLMSLHELRQFLPNAANTTLALSVHAHDFLVLDIESTCPPQIARQFIETLPWTYAEVSMSGKGYHLILPVPDNFAEFPFAADKTKLQEENRHYEIIIDHLITFTRKPIPTHPASPGDTSESRAAWMDLYASLAQHASERQEVVFDVSEIRPRIPFRDQYLTMAAAFIERHPYPRQPDYFSNDMSRWEFGYLSYIQLKIRDALYNLTPHADLTPQDYTNEMIAWMMYDLALTLIPHRPKHDELRGGLPYLLARCQQNVASSAHV